VPSTPCAFLWGHMKTSCENAQKTVPGNGGNGGDQTGSSGGVFSGPGSDWWRQAMFRVVEVVVGVAMIIAAVKSLSSGSSTINVVTKGVKKVASV